MLLSHLLKKAQLIHTQVKNGKIFRSIAHAHETLSGSLSLWQILFHRLVLQSPSLWRANTLERQLRFYVIGISWQIITIQIKDRARITALRRRILHPSKVIRWLDPLQTARIGFNIAHFHMNGVKSMMLVRL